MKFLKKPVAAIVLAVLIVLSSTAISISVKLNNKCEKVIDGFYYGVRVNGQLTKSIYYNIIDLCDISGEIVIIADNYGVDTRALSSTLETMRRETDYHNEDIDEIYNSYDEFYNALFTVMLELSNTDLSQRHLEFMSSASEQISNIKQSIDNSGYNESVRTFYKKFDKFPANFFADIFDVDYPEYFA